MRASKTDLEKLKLYSKEEIIEALGHCYQSDYIVAHIINELDDRKVQKALSEHEKAIDILNSARTAYMKWRTDMCERYGNGRTVKISDIPPSDFQEGVFLERNLYTAEQNEAALDKRVNKLLKIDI